MCHARSKLAEGAQFVSLRRTFALLFLLGNVVSDSEDTGRLAIDDNRRSVHQRIADCTISRHVSRFESLRLAVETGDEACSSHITICIVNIFEEVTPDQFAHF